MAAANINAGAKKFCFFIFEFKGGKNNLRFMGMLTPDNYFGKWIVWNDEQISQPKIDDLKRELCH